MIDYILVTKHLPDKDTPYFGNCKEGLVDYFSSGWERRFIQGCERLEVWYNPSLNTLRLKGSIMYFAQGHNFSFDKVAFVEAINLLQRLLHIELWGAMVEAFEYGVIMEVESKPKDYITHHSASPHEKLTMNEKGKDKGSFRWWEDTNVRLKMYDEGKNLKEKQSREMRSVIQGLGWNPDSEYLKWEVHYLKPEMLNHGKGILLADLMNPNWEEVFKEDLYIQYKRLIPMKSLITPTNKKDLSTPDIIVLALADTTGEGIQEVKKMLYAKINSIPDEVLSKSDKDSRKRQVKALLEKLNEEPDSKWDLSAKIDEALMCGD